MTTLLCLNPNSRSGDTDPQAFVDRLAPLGPVSLKTLDADDVLEQALEAHGDGLKRIVIGGGDGTINRALRPVRKSGLPLGILPLGTANDFARSLQLPDDPLEALDVVVAGHTREVTLGEANGHLFMNAAGIGLGPDLTRSMDYERKQRLGVLAYLVSLIEVLGRRRRRTATLRIDGKRVWTRFLQITVANGRHYGGGLTIEQEADVDDRILRVLCLQPQSTLNLFGKLATLLTGVARGEEFQDGMRLYRARRVRVITQGAVDVSIDGELLTRTPLDCRKSPEPITVFAPVRDES